MSLEAYLRDISQFQHFPKEEELEIAKRAKLGDEKAREELIVSNLKFVITEVEKYSRNGNINDLIQAGNKGLVEAFEHFDPDKGCKFISYAKWWIRNSVYDYFAQERTIQLSEYQRTIIRKINLIRANYYAENEQEPSNKYISQELGKLVKKKYSEKDISEFLNLYKNTNVVSLNMSLGSESDAELLDFVKGADGRIDSEKSGSETICDKIKKSIDHINTDSITRNVLLKTLFEQRQYRDIAYELKITVSKVEQKYKLGLRMLRNYLLNDTEFLAILPDYRKQTT